MIWVPIAVLALGTILTLLWVLRRRRAAGSALVSVVLLRREKRLLTESDVRGAARRALGPSVDVRPVPSPDPGTTDGFVIMLDEQTPGFFVISAGRTYADDPDEVAKSFEDPRARSAYAAHRAWVAVDVAGGMPPPDLWPQVRAMLGKLAAELYDEGCTMLYAPALGRVALPGKELENQLQAGDLSQVFGDDQVNVPILTVESGNRKFERAIAQAQREFPRLVEVWGRHGPACKALVKGRFPHDNGNEYMWLEVQHLSAVQIAGVLVNEPAHVALKKGQMVTLTPAEVADWACLDGEKPMGMFVERLLH
jgi:uncharacterized protein YegJ (DUF2314 family)